MVVAVKEVTAGGGGGLTGDGGGTWGGQSFISGGYGGDGNPNQSGIDGGFGGGAGGGGANGAGGGGGYSGGAYAPWSYSAGGGGSYNSGLNQLNQTGVSEDHGQVIISYIASSEYRNKVIINEVQIQPVNATYGESFSEYIEIKNLGSELVDLNGWTLSTNSGSTTVNQYTPLDAATLYLEF